MAIFVSVGHVIMNIEDNVRSPTVTSSLTSSTLKRVFVGVISAYLSISDVKLDIYKYFEIFKMAAILRS